VDKLCSYNHEQQPKHEYMGKIIKEKARKSLPVFIILCLVNLFFAGFSFNLNLDFANIHKEGLINMAMEAQADNASTTVNVQNAPPWFTTAPAENPSSTSTNPVNVGGSIGFEGTASDGEGDAYWLIICTTTEATSTIGNMVPTCVGGSPLCLSASTTSDTQATCTHTNVKNIVGETQVWYAFICDEHTGDPRCSVVGAQGSGNSGSPFYVNHSPTLVNAYTSVDNQPPGGTFTIFAESTDTDVTGGADSIEMYACSTNSWTLASGCASTTLCTGSSTAPDVSCNYTDTAPTRDQAYNYWVFIKDWHELTGLANGDTSTYNITNVAPTISNVTLNQGQNISLNIKNAPTVDVFASSTSVTDNNGCIDIVSATSTVYLGTVAGGANCTANNNNCYKTATTYCFLSGCTGDPDSDATMTVVCSTSLAFHAVPTDAQAGSAATSWFARLTAWDEIAFGSGSYTTVDGVEVVSTAALDVTESNINYGIIQAGMDSGTSNGTTTIVNFGNTPIDTDVTGTDMLRSGVGPQLIGIERQQHSLSNFAWGAGTQTSSTTPSTVDVVVDRPTSATDVTDQIYWGIGLPLGIPSAQYEGENTFTVVEDLNGNWN
jgi:hypothetical protein